MNIFKRWITNVKNRYKKLENNKMKIIGKNLIHEDEEKDRCIICFESNNAFFNHLISPCECKGSIGKIHLRCLSNLIDYQGSIYCRVCKNKYQYSFCYKLFFFFCLSFFCLS